MAGDADRREIEHDLHDGVQQLLVALAVKVQLARQVPDEDPAAAEALWDEIDRDIQQTVDEAAKLAQRIYPLLLEVGGLAATLRAAAAGAGVPAVVEVPAKASYPSEVAMTIYLCFLGVLRQAGAGRRVTVTVRDEEEAVCFDVVVDGSATSAATALVSLCDRVEALGGRLTIQPELDATRLFGSLPRR